MQLVSNYREPPSIVHSISIGSPLPTPEQFRKKKQRHEPWNTELVNTRVSTEVSNQLVNWLITYLLDLQPTYIVVIAHLLSTMDIPVGILIMTYYNLNSKKTVNTVCFKNVFPREKTGPTKLRVATCLPHCPDACWSRIPTNIPTSRSRNFPQPAEGVCLEDKLPGLGYVEIGSPLFISHEKDIWKGNVALLRFSRFFCCFFSFSTLHGRIFQLSLLTRKGKVLSSREHHRRSKPQFWMPITSSIVNTSVATTILGQCKREVTTYSKKSLPIGDGGFLNGNWNGMSGPKVLRKNSWSNSRSSTQRDDDQRC